MMSAGSPRPPPDGRPTSPTSAPSPPPPAHQPPRPPDPARPPGAGRPTPPPAPLSPPARAADPRRHHALAGARDRPLHVLEEDGTRHKDPLLDPYLADVDEKTLASLLRDMTVIRALDD